jgi:hypothetical protein
MKLRHSLVFVFLFFYQLLQAQQTRTISGYVEDAASGERLIGASVFELLSQEGTSTNVYGFFSITLPEDTVRLRISFVGYTSYDTLFVLNQDARITVRLSTGNELKEFTVEETRPHQSTQMSTHELQMDMVKSLPVLLGERDILKTIQLLPGVQSGTEGSSGLYVRGGGPDQNLMLLDGVPVYNASHLFGFFSVFNSDAISSVDVVKGGFPAQYGGRLSSVIDIRMKEGNMKEWHGEGSVGLIASRFTLEGPIKKDKTSFMLSARRTYIDLLARPLIKASNDGNPAGYFFYDVNGKINHRFSERSRIFFSAYLGNDKFYSVFEDSYLNNNVQYDNKSSANLIWGNMIYALRWNYEFNNKLFCNFTGTYSRYRFEIGATDETIQNDNGDITRTYNAFEYFSGINDWTGKADFFYIPNTKHYVRFGVGNIYHTFTPGVNTFEYNDSSTDLDTTFGSQKQFAHEFSAYIGDDWEINPRLKVNVGLHYSGFLVSGKYYNYLQPRFSGRYMLNENASVKFSYSRMAQYIHLLTNAGIGLPTDLWVPVTERIKPQLADQVAAGYSRSFKKDYQVSVEAYFKYMQNLIEYKDGASFFGSSQDWQDKVEMGRGWSYGAEFLIEKKIGKTTGWIGYTLSWTNRQFDNLNFGEVYPYRYDGRHDIGIAITHHISEKVDVGVVWVYGTGAAVTLGYERYNVVEASPYGNYFNEVIHVDSRNNYRMPAYHRLDVGINFHKKREKFERTWSIGIYNVYSRQNAFFLDFGYNDDGDRVLKQYSLFPIIPSFSYSFKF